MKETLKQSEELLNVSTPPIPHSLWVWSVLQISIFKKKKSLSCTQCVTQRGCMLGCFSQLFLLFPHSWYLLCFTFILLHFYTFAFLFLLFRRSVSCVWNRRVLLEKLLICRRRWSGRIKKLGYGQGASSFSFNHIQLTDMKSVSSLHWPWMPVFTCFHFLHTFNFVLHSATLLGGWLCSGLRATERIHRCNPNWARWAQRRSREAERYSEGTQCVEKKTKKKRCKL